MTPTRPSNLGFPLVLGPWNWGTEGCLQGLFCHAGGGEEGLIPQEGGPGCPGGRAPEGRPLPALFRPQRKQASRLESGEEAFCVGVRWERQPPSTREHWLILPRGEKQPLFSVHRQATQKRSLG